MIGRCDWVQTLGVMRQDDEAPAGERYPCDVAEPMSGRDRLFQQHEQGEPGDPIEGHYAAHEQQPQQEPAATDTVRAVLKPHPNGASGAPPPMRSQESDRMSTVTQAGLFDGGQLVESRGK